MPLGDCDDICAYTYPKTVHVRHKWLGMLYYGIVIMVVLYIVIVQLYLEKGYATIIPLTGAVRATTTRSHAQLAPLSSLLYCEQAHSGNVGAWIRPCVSWPARFIERPIPSLGVLIGTRITKTQYARDPACGLQDYGCEPWVPTGANETLYVGDVESSMVTLQQSAYDSHNDVEVDSFASGRKAATVHGAGGVTQVVPTADGDTVSLREILRVACVDLNNITSCSPTATRSEAPLRYRGLTVVVSVTYAGTIDDVSYSYYAWADEIDAAVYDIHDVLDPISTAVNATTIDLHGVQLILEQTGGVYKPDVRTALLTLVAGSALVAIARTLANLFLLYLAPNRRIYRLFVYADSPDLDPDTPAERAVLDAVVARKTWKDDYLHNRLVQGECPPLVAVPQASAPDDAHPVVEERSEADGVALVKTGSSRSS